MRSAYAAHNRNPETVRRSSSGGIFSLLAAHVVNEGGRVYGAACGENGRISYRGISRTAEIPELCGSKYVFVPIAPVMDEIAGLVKDGQTVLAVVSPCQTAALRRACGDSERLILVDFICHGAPPAEFWDKYRAECAQAHGAAVTGVNFRRKIPGMDWQSYEVELQYADGTIERRRAVDDPYMQTFLRNASLRKACASCAAKGENRASDLTLGDFWGVKKVAPEQYHPAGTSLVFVRTPRGEELWQSVQHQLVSHPVDAAQAVQYNPSAHQPAVLHPQYDAFWRDVPALTVRELADKYCRPSASERLKRGLKRMLGRG